MTKKKPLEELFGPEKYAKFLEDQREANANPELYRKNVLLNNIIKIKLYYNHLTPDNLDDFYDKRYDQTIFHNSELSEDEKIRILFAPLFGEKLTGKIEIKQDVPEKTFINASILIAEKALEIINGAFMDDYYKDHISKQIKIKDLSKLSAKISLWIGYLNEKQAGAIVNKILMPGIAEKLFNDLSNFFDPRDHDQLKRTLRGEKIRNRIVFHGTAKNQLPYVFRELNDNRMLFYNDLTEIARWIFDTFKIEIKGHIEDFNYSVVYKIIQDNNIPIPRKRIPLPSIIKE